MAKTVGSNFFLKDRRLSASFKKGGFDALSAEHFDSAQCKAGAESATSQPLSSLYWLPINDSHCSLSIQKNILPVYKYFVLRLG
ncbi:hypothetical protein COT44_00750 [Candidatus Shapirobacteria bacterium CG08_land_8_20_14_0_20_39_18]|uniref:Uncharacterized protein n=1 Tax=Candidatus Shapirobacteria bacterium CG08_land_8_20_14_0_20_39_18 TaxID=1974883 RepID=A0A2M6XE07_9BACT|nr:MAG: hypothetical protein COT44_00750 [Candidatus Shapirobacteria bacterium CG08_land_8_20_14_0_20_39_18]PJE68266.1 MAG: hypothetical protein COU94_02770 [Candidatus Shapirobacteria bacterium CG10_big_fil_rev_8_21_14_0_10_38_8]